MSRIKLVTMVALMSFSGHAAAVITQVRATPPRTTVSPLQGGQTFTVTWVVSTDAAHTLGAVSAAGEFYNATTGANIAQTIRTTIGSAAGTGPLSFPESLTLSGAQLAAWRSQGIRLIGYRRSFVAPGGLPVAAQWLIDLRGVGLDERASPGGALDVQRLDLTFDNGQRLAMVERDAPLHAQVSVAFSGSGTLRGRWEVAESGADGDAFFRVLSQVRELLGGGQVATLSSPVLPTAGTGRYRVRFCVEQVAAVTTPCAESTAAVQGRYQVIDGQSYVPIRAITPDNQVMRGGDSFRWPAVADATTLQLQIFLPAGPGQEPRFVTGILMPGTATDAPLSVLAQSKLSAGSAYLWRVTAHDADGRLIARSELQRLVFRP